MHEKRIYFNNNKLKPLLARPDDWSDGGWGEYEYSGDDTKK